ncbi:MAG: hypothetical protein Q8K65_04035 [Alphaproteobacteria bacterium]|nr:hypothetical protein [Alphaproteobacteria bacterium]
MKPHKDPADPNPPPPRKPTPALKDFIKAVTPKGAGPAQDLTTRFRDSRARDSHRSYIVPSLPKDSAEYFVELRIREWMMRKEREEAELRRQQKAQNDRNKNSPPPAPPPPRH